MLTQSWSRRSLARPCFSRGPLVGGIKRFLGGDAALPLWVAAIWAGDLLWEIWQFWKFKEFKRKN